VNPKFPWLGRLFCKYLWHNWYPIINKHGVLTNLVCTKCGFIRDLFWEDNEERRKQHENDLKTRGCLKCGGSRDLEKLVSDFGDLNGFICKGCNG